MQLGRGFVSLLALVLQYSSVALCAKIANSVAGADASTLMLISGVSGPEEICIQGMDGAVHLYSCASAIAAGDGRELWSLQAGGKLLHVATQQCASSTRPAVGEPITLMECAGAGSWKILPNGQVQLGSLCLSQVGVAAGLENVAVRAAVQATSSANTASHGPAAAVDADSLSFWASKPDEAGPVVFSVDLGEKRSISHMKIMWEMPAQSFTVAVSGDDEHWVDIFTTDVNMEKVTQIPVRQAVASKLKIVMHKPNELYGKLWGHSYYGIKSISVMAARTYLALEECASAAKSRDARDKYFAAYVSGFDPTPAAAMEAEVPALAIAKASLSTSLSEVVASHAKLPVCRGHQALIFNTTAGTLMSALHEKVAPASDELGELVSGTRGVDLAGARELLASAKTVIVGLRESLR